MLPARRNLYAGHPLCKCALNINGELVLVVLGGVCVCEWILRRLANIIFRRPSRMKSCEADGARSVILVHVWSTILGGPYSLKKRCFLAPSRDSRMMARFGFALPRTRSYLLFSMARRKVLWRAMIEGIGLHFLPMLRGDRRSDINFDIQLLGRRRRTLEGRLVRLEITYTGM